MVKISFFCYNWLVSKEDQFQFKGIGICEEIELTIGVQWAGIVGGISFTTLGYLK